MNSVLVVEDYKMIQDWLVDIATECFDDVTVYKAAGVKEAIKLLATKRVDLALVDLGLPDGSGTEIIAHLHEHSPNTIAIVTTIYDDEEHLIQAIEAGAMGYLLKDEPRESLVSQLQSLQRGGVPISSAVTKRMFTFVRSQPSQPVEEKPQLQGDNVLTPREIEVLTYLSKGFNRKEVAEYLNISSHTVAGYTKSIYKKLDICSRAEAAIVARNHGYV